MRQMKSVISPGVGVPEGALDLSFGFDDPNFSDRTLLLHITNDAAADDSSLHLPNVKRRRSDVLNNDSTDATISPPPRVKGIHVNSLILAARSPFFRKLFSNGMQEPEQKQVTLRIESSEVDAFMDLLKYVYYSNSLPTTLNALLGLLVVADKFEVDSCLRDGTRALQGLSMTCELASACLNLSPSLMMSPRVEPLVNAAKKFLVAEFQDLYTSRKEVLNLSLVGFQAVISSDDLLVGSEIEVYDVVLEWARKHYPDLEKRREILKTHLLRLVRFPFMTPTELTKNVRICSDIDRELASDIVINALCFKAETNCHQKHILAAEETNVDSRQFVERAYIDRPVKVLELELPHPQCVVYFDLTRDDLDRIFPSGALKSETFHLGGVKLCLVTECCFGRASNMHFFGLCLGLLDNETTCTIKYEFALRKSPQDDFVSWFRGSHKFTPQDDFVSWFRGSQTDFKCDFQLLHRVGWDDFVVRNNSNFINGILHIRAELTIEK